MFHFLRIPCSTSRIRCSTSSGIDVPLPPDSVFHFLRNTQLMETFGNMLMEQRVYREVFGVI